ncbi:MAG: transposase [Myxococcota bacterium]
MATNAVPQLPTDLETSNDDAPLESVAPTIAPVQPPSVPMMHSFDPTAMPPIEPQHDDALSEAGRRRRRRWDPETKARLTKEAAELRANGMRWTDVAKQLNVLEGSLRKWLEDYEGPNAVPVQRDPEAVAKDVVAATEPGALNVVTPEGFRVEGLDLEGAHMLIEMLRSEA